MSIASGVVLFVIGAILFFAVHVEISFISLSTVGAILMAAGALVFVIALIFTLRGRRSVSSTTVDPQTGGRTTRSSISSDDQTRF